MTNEITTNVEMTAECKNDLDWIIEECLDFADFGGVQEQILFDFAIF